MQVTYEDIVRKWYNKLKPLFTNTLKRNYDSLSYDAIDDIYQDSFMAVYENLLRGRIKENTSWSAYILQIGMNMANKSILRIKKHESMDGGFDSEDEHKSGIVLEVEKALLLDGDNPLHSDQAIKLLGDELILTPEPCNTIIRMYYYDNLSFEDIAAAINFKNGDTVKAKKWQCMKTFIERVKAAFKREEIID